MSGSDDVTKYGSIMRSECGHPCPKLYLRIAKSLVPKEGVDSGQNQHIDIAVHIIELFAGTARLLTID